MEMQNSNIDIYTCKAKTLYDGEWITGYYLQSKYWFDGEPMHFIFQANEVTVFPRSEFTDAHEIDPSTLCRCTGIADKHGNLIFENDIVITEFDQAIKKRVRWDHYSAQFDLVYYKENEWLCIPLFDADILEVIGNKFDNTELMED